jgi:hypothetical protein
LSKEGSHRPAPDVGFSHKARRKDGVLQALWQFAGCLNQQRTLYQAAIMANASTFYQSFADIAD